MYPSWRYHETKKPEGLIVHSEEEEKELGAGWVDTPAKFGKSEKIEEPKAEGKKKKTKKKVK